MGRRKNRKQERRLRRQEEMLAGFGLLPGAPVADPYELGLHELSVDDFPSFWGRDERPRPTKACGNCREFVEDAEGGRGRCLHPGSGIVAPWTDTPAGDFHAARRR
jgi:hypothetical protein